MLAQANYGVVVRAADDAFESDASWQQPTATALSQMMRESLRAVGTSASEVEVAAAKVLTALEANDADPLNIFINTSRA